MTVAAVRRSPLVAALVGAALSVGFTSGERDAAAKKPTVTTKVAEEAADKTSEKSSENSAKPARTSGSEKSVSEKPLARRRDEPPELQENPLWADLMSGNRRFVAGRAKERELLKSREELNNGQHPQVMILGCADSRVPPEIVFDKNLGELFVVRVAGNIAEPSAIGSLEYGAEHLHARLLIVLGHEKCGAVAAAASGEWMPSANLHDIIKRINPALAKVKACRDPEELSGRQVEANVTQSAADIVRLSPILAKAVDEGELTIIRAVYHLKTGEVERIEGEGQRRAESTAEAKEEPKPEGKPEPRKPAVASSHDPGEH